ncbi:hypothetical protein C356_03726 [Cryptococcus neoformans c45]|nr:hypothetical protein C356_03726 [Cryptococcus neoformans var. grubii c45]
MGNTPSHQQQPSRASPPNTDAPQRHPSLRIHMPRRHVSPQSSNPTSPSGGRPGSGSPRRRKSLELPDLNKLSFTPAALTPAAPVPTTHTHTSHHFAPSTAAGHHARHSASPPLPGTPTGAPSVGSEGANGSGTGSSNRYWRDQLGGRASPLAGANSLGALSKLEPTLSANSTGSRGGVMGPDVNPYFPDPYGVQDPSTRNVKAIPIPIPGKDKGRDQPQVQQAAAQGQAQPKPSDLGAIVPVQEEKPKDDGLVDVPIQWNGGGRNVSVAGTWDGGWAKRIKLHRSTHDFNTTIRLPPGQYRLKFIVDDSWRCSKQISTAVDDDGTLVNWIEVEAPKTAEEIKAEWAMDSEPAAKEEDTDESQWTSEIPPALILYQYIEELPFRFHPDELSSFLKSVPYIPNVPAPPTLPRILDKVIVNNDSRRLWDSKDHKGQPGYQHAPPAGVDDNSMLAVPNHVVLNHLTASAIRNGTLGVGTTTRYRKKYITTMFFRDQPAPNEHPANQPVPQSAH